MRNRHRISLAIVSLALAALACQAVTGGSDTTPTQVVVEDTVAPVVTDAPLPSPTEEPASGSDVLLEDSFSAGSRVTWGTGTDADSSVEYADGGLNMQLFRENYIVWSSPNDRDYENVHLEVTVLNNGSDAATAFGFMCNQQWPITDSRYYFAVTPGGEYAIARSALALDDVILSNNGEWGRSDLIAQNADSYRIGADCGNGTLALYVDGRQIASVSDTTYTSGGITLFLWSGEEIATVNMTFDDFLLTRLP